MQRAYAKAIDDLLRNHGMREEEVFKKLHTHLAATGRLKLLPQLLTELRTLAKRNESHEALLEAASENEIPAAERAARKEGITAKAVVEPSLVSGWRLVTGDVLIDRSGKRALLDLYRAITL
ncbi:MAG TPA: F0F1 ATP synthase subunit delta [Candidatus Paceibacterota bacterium]|jgi:F0F1-type ATP synthase delta subunit